jgi:hypothetical protein
LSRTIGQAVRSPLFIDTPTASQPCVPNSLRCPGINPGEFFLRPRASDNGISTYSHVCMHTSVRVTTIRVNAIRRKRQPHGLQEPHPLGLLVAVRSTSARRAARAITSKYDNDTKHDDQNRKNDPPRPAHDERRHHQHHDENGRHQTALPTHRTPTPAQVLLWTEPRPTRHAKAHGAIIRSFGLPG